MRDILGYCMCGIYYIRILYVWDILGYCMCGIYIRILYVRDIY